MFRTALILGMWAALLAPVVCLAGAAEPKAAAVLFAGSDGGHCGYEVADRLAKAGFALRVEHARLSDRPLAWDTLKHYNAVVVSGLWQANTFL